jgi:hypothetical protein
MKKATVSIAKVWFEKDGQVVNSKSIEVQYSQEFPGRKNKCGTYQMAAKLGYTQTVGEFAETPIDSIKRKVPYHSSTFIPDPRNNKGVGNLHASRISLRTSPLDPRYCNSDGSFCQEW